MATAPRLTFLYPVLFRTNASHYSATHHVSKFRDLNRSGYHTTRRKQQQEVRSRYGTANEPPPHVVTNDRPADKSASQSPQDSKSRSSTSYNQGNAASSRSQDKETGEKKKGKDVDSSPDRKALGKSAEKSSQDTVTPTELPKPDLSEPQPSTTHAEQPTTTIKPLETVLHMEPHSSTREDPKRNNKHPHFVTPPYVHHFDTYTLVRALETGGFSQDQAVTCMKAVRSLLALNMDLAREGLVSKSDVENETYLFKAACSELKTEIQNQRRREVEKMRTERMQLQHEFDILNQRVGQETSGLKDELKGMFDDRKMGVRMEQRTMESTIQQLNYKITVALNSDSRSEVEGLRWVLTRRAGIAIVISAVMMLGGASYISRLEAEEKDRKQKKKAGGEPLVNSEGRDEGASPQSSSEASGGAGDALANLSSKDGMSPGYVSLG
ncbi:hypothetical protein EV356DRAFT_518843 [Viridothelium virens]|uniref:DUF1640-domain-containing protein n=1 Tax=Viridothelium virens TaxID=1048519 RepID=A0A6A6HK72_VIRVR|nr:hypothetical protein EV356DRAFT_518843 [Viridothelium virens]